MTKIEATITAKTVTDFGSVVTANVYSRSTKGVHTGTYMWMLISFPNGVDLLVAENGNQFYLDGTNDNTKHFLIAQAIAEAASL